MTGAERTVHVVGAYMPNGGTYMAYHLALILHRDFGFPINVLVVGDETISRNVLPYSEVFPTTPFLDIRKIVRQNDIVLCNPGFTVGEIGLGVQGFKIMYVQGFSRFRMLDLWFDHYVTVSPFVKDYVRSTFGLQTACIPPFLPPASLPKVAWADRPPFSLALNLKGLPEIQNMLLQKLRGFVRERAPVLEAAVDWDNSILKYGLAHTEFLSQIGGARHYLSLSIAEGFGLVPLEAMAAGTLVLGLDGYGGRAYMSRGENCRVRPYPDVSGVADDLIWAIEHPDAAEQLAANGPATADFYSYERFQSAWRTEFEQLL